MAKNVDEQGWMPHEAQIQQFQACISVGIA